MAQTINLPITLDEIALKAVAAAAAERGVTVPQYLGEGVTDKVLQAGAKFQELLALRSKAAFRDGTEAQRVALIGAVEAVERAKAEEQAAVAAAAAAAKDLT